MFTVQAVKFYADGAIGSWSAALIDPYLDNPNVTGTLVRSLADLRSNVSAWARQGYQIATHAIGDAAIQQVLDAYEAEHADQDDKRWRVEHAQIVAAADMHRFASLDILPSMQPSHCASDLAYALERLGQDRASRSYAWMSLLRSGISALPFGSDFPTAGSVPPLLGLHAAVTRETAEGWPQGGWFPEQRVTAIQALRGYTVDAAYASFRENELGRIQKGFRADLTIFDRDILTVDAKHLLESAVLGTVVGGRVVYAVNTSFGHNLAQLTSEKSVFREATQTHLTHEKPNNHIAPWRYANILQRWWQTYAAEVSDDAVASSKV